MKNLDWDVVINNDTYKVIFSKDITELEFVECDYPRVMNLHELERNKRLYLLVTLENGTFRLYSRKGRKLILSGVMKRLRWISKVKESC